MRSGRNHLFDLLRLCFALMVLLAHAPEIVDGNPTRELLHRITHGQSLGGLAVDGFFLLSGYLVGRSWIRRPHVASYMRARVLRIVPGYLVAAILSIAVVGMLATPGTPFFTGFNSHTLASLMVLGSPLTPPAFPGAHFHIVNGSLWTIPYEFRCYLLLIALGWCGCFRHPARLLLALALFAAPLLSPWVAGRIQWHHFFLFTGDPAILFHLTTVFLLGVVFYFFRERIVFRPAFAAGAIALLLGSLLHTAWFEAAAITCGSYLMFYAGTLQLRWPALLVKMPDISYGIYLYGWPVEMLWFWYRHDSPWVLFAGSAVIACGLGILSWTLVEKPMIAFGQRRSRVATDQEQRFAQPGTTGETTPSKLPPARRTV